MSDPTFVTGFGQYYYLCDRDPTSSEPNCYLNISNFKYMWFNTTDGSLWWCVDNTEDAMVWEKLALSTDIPDMSNWEINTARTSSSITPPSFNSSRRPSTTNDVFVSSNISFTSVLSLSAQVNLEISPDNSSWTTYAKSKQELSIAATIIDQLCALVPAGSYYRFTSSGSGGSIDSIYEIRM